MQIQLLTDKKQILYELEQSELFPDFRSVLREAIALNIDLTNLSIESEMIDEVIWKGNDLKGVFFNNCSMKKNEFIECNLKSVYISNCDCQSTKFKKTTIIDFDVMNTDSSMVSFKNCTLDNGLFLSCNLVKTNFYNSKTDHVSFNSTNLSEVFFKDCEITNGSFIHDKANTEWMINTYFVGCCLSEIEMRDVQDVSSLYFWETNVREIKFMGDQQFTEVINDRSKVLYAVDSDVVWWKPYSWDDDERRIFRGTLKEFADEVRNEFPTTDLYPSMMDYEIENELLRVCLYLESWNRSIE